MIDAVIEHLEQALADQRAENARGYDREAALVELRGFALDLAVSRNQHDITPQQLWAGAETPEDRARLQSLVDRALSNSTTPEEVPA